LTVLKVYTKLGVASMVCLQGLDSEELNRSSLGVVVRACETKECHSSTGCADESFVEVEKAQEG
jgi:hypothetical protein